MNFVLLEKSEPFIRREREGARERDPTEWTT